MLNECIKMQVLEMLWVNPQKASGIQPFYEDQTLVNKREEEFWFAIYMWSASFE